MGRDKCLSSIGDPNKTNFKIGDMVLIRCHTPKDIFDSKYKLSFRMFKKILDKAFDVKDSVGKVRQVSIQHLQVLYPMEHMLTNLPDITSFEYTIKYLNTLTILTRCQIWVLQSKQRLDMHDIINTCNMHQSNLAHLQYHKYLIWLSEVRHMHNDSHWGNATHVHKYWIKSYKSCTLRKASPWLWVPHI